MARKRSTNITLECASPTAGGAKRVCAAGALALIAITTLAYIPALRGGFIWDDDSYVEHNSALRSAAGLWNIWAHTSATPQYYPLVHTTFWIEYHLWGTD